MDFTQTDAPTPAPVTDRLGSGEEASRMTQEITIKRADHSQRLGAARHAPAHLGFTTERQGVSR
jgi:hypothetical protein